MPTITWLYCRTTGMKGLLSSHVSPYGESMETKLSDGRRKS